VPIVTNGEMIPNDQGVIARNEWFKTAQLQQYLTINEDEFVIVPNHAHGVIWIKDDHVVGMGHPVKSLIQ